MLACPEGDVIPVKSQYIGRWCKGPDLVDPKCYNVLIDKWFINHSINNIYNKSLTKNGLQRYLKSV